MRRLAPASFLVVVLLQATWSLLHPDYNWDTIPYLALLRSADAGAPADAVAVHAEAYRELERVAPPARFHELVDGTEHRRAVYADPRKLEAHLPFYRVKPLYLWLARAPRALGASLSLSLLLVSALGYVATALVLWAWLRGALAPPAALAVGTLLAVTPPLAPLAGLATPDAISTALVVTAAWLVLDRDAPAWGALVFAASLLARTNNVVLGAALVLVWALRSRDRVSPRGALGVAALACGVAIVLAVNRATGAYGWQTLVRHSFSGYLADPSAAVPALTARGYLGLLVHGLPGANHSTLGAPLLLLAAAALSRARPWADERVRAAAALAGSVAVHFALFPALTDRFFVAQAVAIDVLAVGVLAGVTVDATRPWARARAVRTVESPEV